MKLHNKLIIAISSRALFDLDDGHEIFENNGIEAYREYQIEQEKNILEPGVAFQLTKKLSQLVHPETNKNLVEVILLSRNSADTGLRVFNSIQAHELNITRAAFTSGESPFDYINAFEADLFLSANGYDVREALDNHIAAATIFPGQANDNNKSELRIAFDGDAVIFSDEAEKIYQHSGLDEFIKQESDLKNIPLPGGPFKNFLACLHTIQKLYSPENCPIRTALVTARSAPAHERVVNTLRDWQIRIDEAIFLGGLEKTGFLEAFGADFFFDDQTGHCRKASDKVATGHVPFGVVNEGNLN